MEVEEGKEKETEVEKIGEEKDSLEKEIEEVKNDSGALILLSTLGTKRRDFTQRSFEAFRGGIGDSSIVQTIELNNFGQLVQR